MSAAAFRRNALTALIRLEAFAAAAFLILQPGSAGFDLVKLLPVGAGLCYAANVIVNRV